MRKSNIKLVIYVIVFILALFIIFMMGTYYGYSNRPNIEKIYGVNNKYSPEESTADFDPFWKAWNLLKEKSIYAKDIKNDQDYVWGAISGLASSFNDPYTIFLPPEENKEFEEEVRGSFEGIGAELGVKDKLLTIVAPLKNTPAEKAGLKSGDKIIEIDKKSTADISSDEAVKLIIKAFIDS